MDVLCDILCIIEYLKGLIPKEIKIARIEEPVLTKS